MSVATAPSQTVTPTAAETDPQRLCWMKAIAVDLQFLKRAIEHGEIAKR